MLITFAYFNICVCVHCVHLYHQKQITMKKQILNKIANIQKVAELTGMEGKLTLEFTGCTMQEWDDAIESITEYPRHNHFVEITPKLTVTLLFG